MGVDSDLFLGLLLLAKRPREILKREEIYNQLNILKDFAETKLYEENFLTDLEEGLKKSSPCK